MKTKDYLAICAFVLFVVGNMIHVYRVTKKHSILRVNTRIPHPPFWKEFFEYHEDFVCSGKTPLTILQIDKAKTYGELIPEWVATLVNHFNHYQETGERISVVFLPLGDINPAEWIMRPSACQTPFNQNPHQFLTVHLNSHLTTSISVERYSKVLPLAYFLRRAYDYFFYPRVDWHRDRISLHRFHPGPPYEFGLHAQLGDVCFYGSTNINCFLIWEYFRFVNPTITAYAATNDKEFDGTKLGIGNFTRLQTDREKYSGTWKENLFGKDFHLFFSDFVYDIFQLARSKNVVGRCSSSAFNMAIFMGTEKNYYCLDKSFPCFYGGCPNFHQSEGGECFWMDHIFKSVKSPENLDPLYLKLEHLAGPSRDYCTASKLLKGWNCLNPSDPDTSCLQIFLPSN